ncbi:Tn3 family transposase [Bacillus paramycoides]|uniref:Tn3 family transposase n=1 Tax=Bacillus paramycoides TaxID=2026194 RepID=UPI00399CFA53
MKTRELLTTAQREYFYGIPDYMDEREILRYYTISHEELQIINKQRGAANRLGFAIQIAYLRFPGRPLSTNEKVPDFIVHLREIGRIEKTLYTLEWLQSPELRRRVHVGLNKGEAKHALARAVFFNRLGEIRDRSYEDQLHRASGLQLLISAIVLWNTVYISHAVDALRAKGVDIPEEHLQHISPLGWEHITLTGDYVGNLNQKTNFNSLRPLRDKNSIKKQ